MYEKATSPCSDCYTFFTHYFNHSLCLTTDEMWTNCYDFKKTYTHICKMMFLLPKCVLLVRSRITEQDSANEIIWTLYGQLPQITVLGQDTELRQARDLSRCWTWNLSCPLQLGCCSSLLPACGGTGKNHSRTLLESIAFLGSPLWGRRNPDGGSLAKATLMMSAAGGRDACTVCFIFAGENDSVLPLRTKSSSSPS